MDTPDTREQYKGPSFQESDAQVLDAVNDSGQEISQAKRAVPGQQRGASEHAPYYIEHHGSEWVVVNRLGEVKGRFNTKAEARQQQKALYVNVPGAKEEAEKHHGDPKPKVKGAVVSADEPQGQARGVNVDSDSPRSVCAECGQPIVQFQNGGWAHLFPGRDTCGDPDPTPMGTVGSVFDREDPNRDEDPVDEAMGAVGGGVADVLSPGKKAAWDDPSWYDGSPASVRERIANATTLRTQAVAEGDWEFAERVAAEVEALKPILAELERDVFEEHVANLPGGTVAAQYGDLVEGGLIDLGPDDGSFLYTAAREVQDEIRGYDWETFAVRGARDWVLRQARTNPGVLRREITCRASAIDYVQVKTTALLDVDRRAAVIDTFVNEAERVRRGAYAQVVSDRMRQDAERAALNTERFDHISSTLDETDLLWT